MKYRLGVCSDCGASYKVPASFEADRAKCKACDGVVEIGQVREDAPTPKPAAAPPMPARKVAPPKPAAAAAPAPAPKPAEKQGPSMKERLLAERAAAAAQAKAAPAAPAKQAPAKPPTKPAAAKSSARATAPASKRASAESSERPARGSARGGSSRRSAPAKSRRGGRGARGGDDEDAEAEDGGRGGRRGGKRGKQGSNPTLLIVSGVMILVAAGAAFFLMNKGGDETVNDTVQAQGNAPEGTLTDVTNETANAPEPEAAKVPAKSTDAPETSKTADATATEEASANGAAAAPPPADPPAAPADKPAKEREFKDPASIDLLAIEDFGVPQGCTPERWAELQDLAKTVMDPFAGAAGGRASKQLVAEGKFAIPAVLNEMKKLDLTVNDEFLTANAAKETLMEICNGINLGWQYPNQQPDTWHYYDKKVIFNWCELWRVWDADDAQFIKRTKRDIQPSADQESTEPGESKPEVGGDDDLDALDDI